MPGRKYQSCNSEPESGVSALPGAPQPQLGASARLSCAPSMQALDEFDRHPDQEQRRHKDQYEPPARHPDTEGEVEHE
jgi:hypothetical protein